MEQIINCIDNTLSETNLFRYQAPDWGQLELLNPPVQFPCVLVGLDTLKYSKQGADHQKVEGEVVITIADKPTHQVSQNAPKNLKANYSTPHYVDH